MKVSFETIEAVLAHGFDEVIDVRSPAEYAEDHLPGAINLPVLDDAERARVGTIYKQQSPFAARVIGAALVARNAAAHLEGPLAGKPGDWRPLVYCWRGGQRSGSFATILGQVGWRVGLVDGGYKSFRRLVAATLHDRPLPHRLVLLDGNTGSAKTDILHRVAALGGQVLDLEGLARHRGSILGGMAQPQPSQKMFETGIAVALAGMDPARPVLVEAESSKIGNLLVPPSLWEAMKHAPRIEIAASPQARAAYLVRAYGDLLQDRDRLDDRLARLQPLAGRRQVAEWRELAAQGAFTDLALSLITLHYDPRYARWREGHPPAVARLVAGDLSGPDQESLAAEILRLSPEIAGRTGQASDSPGVPG